MFALPLQDLRERSLRGERQASRESQREIKNSFRTFGHGLLPSLRALGAVYVRARAKKTSADSITVSESVGCGWMLIATSRASAADSDGHHALGNQFAGPGPNNP